MQPTNELNRSATRALRWGSKLFAICLILACDPPKDDAADAAAAALSALLPPLPTPGATPSAATPNVAPAIASAGARDAAADGGACAGHDCPLQAWMKQIWPHMRDNDYEGTARMLQQCAKLAPPDAAKSGYPNWVSISIDGANAARATDMEAVKAACRGCHEQYKDKYRVEMRTRLLPNAVP